MKYNLEFLKADICDELEKLNMLKKEFYLIENKLNEPKEKISFYDRSAIGYYLHSFYNGCENIFKSIARFFENDLGPQTWHSDLLKRMKLNISGYRPRVIDEKLFYLLNDFRGFRHIFRHSYTFELDWEKQRLIALKFNHTFSLLNEQIENFLQKLKEIEKDI